MGHCAAAGTLRRSREGAEIAREGIPPPARAQHAHAPGAGIAFQVRRIGGQGRADRAVAARRPGLTTRGWRLARAVIRDCALVVTPGDSRGPAPCLKVTGFRLAPE